MNSKKNYPSAYINHQVQGRVRLKIPQKKAMWIILIISQKYSLNVPVITQLQTNPSVASVLICHDIADAHFQTISKFAHTNGLFKITKQPKETISIPDQPIATLASASLSRFDQSLMELSEGLIDTRSLFLLILAVLATHQIGKGKILTPASGLIWTAIELLREPYITSHQQRADLSK
ncbi:MAG: HMA2 domain-containing protein [Methylobacter sp.]